MSSLGNLWYKSGFITGLAVLPTYFSKYFYYMKHERKYVEPKMDLWMTTMVSAVWISGGVGKLAAYTMMGPFSIYFTGIIHASEILIISQVVSLPVKYLQFHRSQMLEL